jgi:ATP/maltotriose-dependent transcriptional regulator MalT
LATAEATVRLGKEANFIASEVLGGGNLAAVYGNLGALTRGMELARQAVVAAEAHFPQFRCHPLGILAHLHLVSGDIAEATAVIEEGKNDPNVVAHPAWNMRLYIAEVELAFRQGDYERTLSLAEYWLARLRETKMYGYILPFLHLWSEAHWHLGQVAAARDGLLEARTIAEATDSQASLWRILLALSQLENDAAAAHHLQAEAREIVAMFTSRISDTDLRASFLALPHVQAATHINLVL